MLGRPPLLGAAAAMSRGTLSAYFQGLTRTVVSRGPPGTRRGRVLIQLKQQALGTRPLFPARCTSWMTQRRRRQALQQLRRVPERQPQQQ
jgi:hypothetical protein